MRKEHVLKIKGSVEGDCLMKCLQEIFYWYGYPLEAFKLAGITNCLNLQILEEDIGKAASFFEIERINHKIINFKLIQGKNLEDSLKTLFEVIDSDNLLIALLNTYHLYYTEDYHKLSGGLFKSYHSVIINGYDLEKQVILVTDLNEMQTSIEVNIEEFGLEWTYTKDATYFEPLKYVVCSRVENPANYCDIMLDSLKYSVNMYLSDMKKAQESTENLQNIFALQKIMSDVINDMYEEKQRVDILNNIVYSIFHFIRWSCKSRGYFFDFDEFKEVYDFSEIVPQMHDLFDDWTLVYNLLNISIVGNNENRLKSAFMHMNETIEKGNAIVKGIANIMYGNKSL